MKQHNPVLHFKGRRLYSAFILLYLIDMFLPITFEDFYFNMQCTRDCNLAEITPIRDLPEQFCACAQQCETSLLCDIQFKTMKSRCKTSCYLCLNCVQELVNYSNNTSNPYIICLAKNSGDAFTVESQ